MRLTHLQRLALQTYLELQRREPSYLKAFRSLLPIWILMLAAGVAAWYAIRTWLISGGPEYLALGLVLGAIIAQMGAVRNFVHQWAAQKQVIDTEAVKRLLAEDDAGKAAGEPVPPPRPLPFGWRTALAVGLAVVALPIAADWAMTAYHDPTRDTAGRQVKLYSTVWCGQCRVVRAHLRKHGVEFEDFDVEKSLSAQYAWAATRARGVPVTVIGNTIVRGADLRKIDGTLRASGFQVSDVAEQPTRGGEPLMSPLK